MKTSPRPSLARRALVPATLALLLPGCEGATPGGCGARSLPLRNASTLAIEQAYGGDGSAGGWGGELLGSSVLPPGESRAIRLPAGARAVRLVWANGRAAELHGVDLCAIPGLTLTDRGLQLQ